MREYQHENTLKASGIKQPVGGEVSNKIHRICDNCIVSVIMLLMAKRSVSGCQFLDLNSAFQTNIRRFHLVIVTPFIQEYCNCKRSTLFNCESEFLHACFYLCMLSRNLVSAQSDALQHST